MSSERVTRQRPGVIATPSRGRSELRRPIRFQIVLHKAVRLAGGRETGYKEKKIGMQKGEEITATS